MEQQEERLIDRSVLDFLQNIPDEATKVIEKYEQKVQEIISEAKLKQNELEKFYEIKIEELQRTVKQITESLEGKELVHQELLVEYEGKLKDKEAEYDELIRKSEDLAHSLDDAKQNLVEAKQSLVDANQTLSQKEDDISSLEAQNQAYISKLDSFKLEVAGLSAQLETAQNSASILTKNINDLLGVKRDLEGKLTQAIADSEKSSSDLQAVIADLKSKIDQVSNDSSAKDTLISQLRSTIDDQKAKAVVDAGTISQLLDENKKLSDQLDALNGVTVKSRRLIEEQTKRNIGSTQKGIEEVMKLKIELSEKEKALKIALGEKDDVQKELVEIKKLKHALEKEKLKMRAEIESDIRRKFGLSKPISPSVPSVEEKTLIEKEEKKVVESKSQVDLVIKKDSFAGVPTLTNSSSDLSLEKKTTTLPDPTLRDQQGNGKRKSVGRQYFGDIKPFSEDLVTERCKNLVKNDFLSVEEITNALATKILKEGDGQLSYRCKDVSAKKFEYLDKKGHWVRDKKMSYLKKTTFPLLQKLSSKFLADEKVEEQPDDEVMARLLQMRENLKPDDEFMSQFKNHLSPKVSYISAL